MKWLIPIMTGLLLAVPAQAQERISHGRFKDVRLYRPSGEVKQFVLFLSGDSGWDPTRAAMARALTQQGAMVAGIHVPRLFAELEADGDACVFPDGDLENLSHFLQGYARLPTYYTPLLVGYSSGASLAYAMLAQAPAGTFAGAISLGFCTELELEKPLCESEQLHPGRRTRDGNMELRPATALPAPWVVLQGERDAVCPTPAARTFAAQVPGSEFVLLPQVGHGYRVEKKWRPALLAAYQKFAARPAAALSPPPASLSDLPLVEVPAATGAGEYFAVLLSGDGGWAGLDKDVAAALVAKGIPVVGLDSLRYFWSARTPQGLAADLDRVLRYYAVHWSRSKVILVGYSQGADVLPFAINRLAPDSRAKIAQAVLMGLGVNASFEFHLGNWVGAGGSEPIQPEAEKLDARQVLCLYGEDEDESLCPKISAAHVHAQSLPGGHHFDGAYDALAELILQRVGVSPRR